mmetsp:Transcript_2252/g.5345  ORF Transcript_2252/g.5345 Transcript_2252/m.5345 type:complete len:200 (-) Transcript_2252:29-628(-)
MPMPTRVPICVSLPRPRTFRCQLQKPKEPQDSVTAGIKDQTTSFTGLRLHSRRSKTVWPFSQNGSMSQTFIVTASVREFSAKATCAKKDPCSKRGRNCEPRASETPPPPAEPPSPPPAEPPSPPDMVAASAKASCKAVKYSCGVAAVGSTETSNCTAKTVREETWPLEARNVQKKLHSSNHVEMVIHPVVLKDLLQHAV